MSQKPIRGDLLTVTEVAERLSLTDQTVRRKIHAGELPGLRLGAGRSSLRVDRGDFERFLVAGRVGSHT
jgi:excisionase family DNA binding protein